MRVKVWTVAGIDTLKFLAGTYGEPAHMRLPLRDAECRQCHSPILKPSGGAAAAPPSAGLESAGASRGADPGDESTFASEGVSEAQTEGRGGSSYHAIRDHDGVDVRCVGCHTSHTTDSDARNRFISKTVVLPICRECHQQM